MRKICYGVVVSLDGYIAGPNGEDDWIVKDPDIDFGEMFARYDTLVMGRKTYERLLKAGYATMAGMRILVFSKTMRAADHLVDFGPGPGVKGGEVIAQGLLQVTVGVEQPVHGLDIHATE